jgi:uncharacterized protein DUF6789
MDAATEKRPATALPAFLAGLQGGMLGVCWMLLWLDVSAIFERRSFWSPENLMASAFYGGSSIRDGFNAQTLSGLALYLLVYSTLGGVFAVLVRDRLPRRRIMLASIGFALLWYLLSFRVIWKAVSPVIFLMHVQQSMVLGHLIYGTVLGRFPLYLEQTPTAAPPASPAEAQATPPNAGDVET